MPARFEDWVQAEERLRISLLGGFRVQPQLAELEQILHGPLDPGGGEQIRSALVAALKAETTIGDAERTALQPLGPEQWEEALTRVQSHLASPTAIPEDDLAVYVPLDAKQRPSTRQPLEDQVDEIARLALVEETESEKAARLALAEELEIEKTARLTLAEQVEIEKAARLALAEESESEEAARLALAEELEIEKAARLTLAEQVELEKAARLTLTEEMESEEAAREEIEAAIREKRRLQKHIPLELPEAQEVPDIPIAAAPEAEPTAHVEEDQPIISSPSEPIDYSDWDLVAALDPSRLTPLPLVAAALEAVGLDEDQFGFLLRYGTLAPVGRNSEIKVAGLGMAEFSKRAAEWFNALGASKFPIQVIDDGSGELTVYLLESVPA